MSATASFASTPHVGSAVVSSTADTSLTAPTHGVTVFTAGANGSKIDTIRVIGTGTTVAGLINIFLYDGSTYHVIDSIAVPAITFNSTSLPFSYPKSYDDLLVPFVASTAWTLVATSTVASQNVNVVASGGDF